MRVDASLIDGNSREAASSARRAEDLGFDGFWSSETTADPLLMSMAAGLSTDTITIGTAVAVAFARSPMTTAYAAWDLARSTNGRFVLGLGTQVRSHVTKRFSMPWDNPVERMADFLEALTAIFRSWREGTPLQHRGRYYRHVLCTPTFTPEPHDHPIPLMIGAVGPDMARLAGRTCDGLLVHAMTNPAHLDAVTIPAVNAGRAAAGRTDAFTLTAPLFLAMGDDDAQILAMRERARERIAFYGSTPAYRPVFDAVGWGDAQPELHRLSTAGDWKSMAAVVTDELVDTMVLSGAPEQMPALVTERFGSRIDRVSSYFGWPIDDPERLRSILDAFRSVGTNESGGPHDATRRSTS
jgi:probable F420-dependent oxidoreductase